MRSLLERSVLKWGLVLFIVLLILLGTLINGQQDNGLTQEERAYLRSQGTLIYSADKDAPPLRFVDGADGQYKGVVVDYINLLSLQLGTNIELHPLRWDIALEELKKGKTHICDMFISNERSKYYLFTDPIYNLRAVVATTNPSVSIKDIDKMTLATQKGDYVNGYLQTHFPNANLIYVENVEEGLQLLVQGIVDGVPGDEPVVLYQLKKLSIENKIHIIEEPLYEEGVVFAVPKTKPDLIPILNKGIGALNSQNQLEQIQQKWFGLSTPIVQRQDYLKMIQMIVVIMICSLIVALALAMWNKALKKEVSKQTQDLLNSKNDLQNTFDRMSESILLLDVYNAVVNCNLSFLNALSISKQTLLGMNGGIALKGVLGNDLETELNRVIEEDKPLSFELKNKMTYFYVRLYPLKDIEGVFKNLLIVFDDVTKEKLAEAQFLQSNKMAAIGQLAAGVAHEIRNPLGIIRHHSFMMQERLRDVHMEKSLGYIDNAVERADRIIENLLEFSRLSRDQKEYVHIRTFLKKILALEHKQLMKQEIKSRLNCSKDLYLWTNKDALRHCLLNIVTNGIEAMDKGGKLTIDVENNTDIVTIKIRDEGGGIPVCYKEKLFDPFFTTKEPGKGTGLGLYIAYNEIKKMNGEINFENIDKGTEFIIRLPVEETTGGKHVDENTNC